MATVKTCAFKSCLKCSFTSQKHVRWCSTSNRDNCGNIKVIFNIFWEQKYWWHVWLLRGSVSQWPVVYFWTGRANVRSEVLLDLSSNSNTGTWQTNRELYTRTGTFWYQFWIFQHVLLAENSEDGLASSCVEFSIGLSCNPVWDWVRGLPFLWNWGVINIRKYPGNIFATPVSARRNFYDPLSRSYFLWPPPLWKKNRSRASMTDFGPPAMLDGPLRFQLSRWSVQMLLCF